MRTRAGGGWELTLPLKETYVFDGAGRLVEVRESTGHGLVLAYEGTTTRVASIASAVSGRSLALTWAEDGPDEAPVVESVTALPAPGTGPAPRWSYSYTDGRLTQACAPQAAPACTEYRYWAGSESTGRQGKLKTVTNPEGVANDEHSVQLDYGPGGRVTTVTNALGKTWTFSDDDDAAEGTYHPIVGFSAGTRPGVTNGQTITQDMSPTGGPVPASGVQAVVVDIGVSGPSTGGWISVYPNGTTEPPGVSMIDYAPGDVRSTLMTVAVSDDGGIKLTNRGSTVNLTFEVVGWYGESGVPGGSVFVPLTTKKIYDSRTVEDGDDPLGAGETRDIQVTGKGGVPTDGVTAVVYDFEGISPTATTLLTAFPKGEARPAITSLALNAGRHTDNLAITKVGQDGKISLYNSTGDIDVELNVVGYFTDPAVRDGLVFRPVTNARLLDSRSPGGQWATAWPPGTTRPVAVTGRAGLPIRGVEAVVGDLQGLNPPVQTYLMTTPAGTIGATSGATNHPQAGQVVGNHFYTGLGEDGSFDLKTASQPMDMIIEVNGYFTPTPRTTRVEDQRGNSVEYRMDEHGQLVSRIDPAGFAVAYAYNEDGLLASQQDKAGVKVEYSYDDKGRVTRQRTVGVDVTSQVRDNWAADSWFGYVDNPGNLALDGMPAWVNDPRSTSATDATYRTAYEYNALGQTTKVTGPSTGGAPGAVTKRTYTTADMPAVGGGSTPAGLLATSTDWIRPDLDEAGVALAETRYFYDSKGDLRVVEHPSPVVNGKRSRRDEFTSDSLGRMVTRTEFSAAHPTGVTSTVKYDDQGRVIEQTGPMVIGAYAHPIEGKDHQLRVANSYDGDGNLVKVTTTDTVNNAQQWVEYSYDADGQEIGTEDWVGRTTSSTYDANGNMATHTAADGATLAYSYNSRNLVEKVAARDVVDDPADAPTTQRDEVTLTQKFYDAAGRLISETDAAGRTTRHTWRPDGQPELSVLSNARATDPDTGALSSSSLPRSVLVAGERLDRAGNPVEAYSPSNRRYSNEFPGTSLDAGWTRTGTWSVADGKLKATSAGTAYRQGAANGRLGVTSGGGPNQVNPVFRRSDDQNFHRLVWLPPVVGSNTMPVVLERVAAGTVTPLAFAAVDIGSPQTERRVEVLLVGERIEVLIDGSPVLSARDETNMSRTGVGIQAATNESISSFAFDEYSGTLNSFDAASRLRESTADPGGAGIKTTWTRLADGRPDVVTTAPATNPTPASTLVTKHGYDPVTGAVDYTEQQSLVGGAPRRTDYTIDDRGLETSVMSPEGARVDRTFDVLGRLVAEKQPDRAIERYNQTQTTTGPTTVVSYNGFGASNAVRDAAGRWTWDWMDARGYPVATIHPGYTAPGSSTEQGRVTYKEFDPVGRVTKSRDASGNWTDFTLNTFGQLVERKDPAAAEGADRGVWDFTYDDAGRLLTRVDPEGGESRQRWDDLNRLVATEQDVTQPSGGESTFVAAATYGDAGGLLRSRSAEGVVTTSEFDLAGRMTRSVDGEGFATTYSYDALSRPSEVKGPDGRSVRTTYDEFGDRSEEQIYGPTGTYLGKSTFKWDKQGRLLETQSPRGVVDPSGFKTSFTYDDLGQLVSRTTPVSGTESITETWGYDEFGQTTRYTDGQNNASWQTYNSMGLPEDSIAPAAGAQTAEPDRRWRSVYDVVGRPVSQSIPGGISVTNSYDSLGRLTETEGAGAKAGTETRTFELDLLGRVTEASAPSGTQNFTYDERGLLRTATGNSGDSAFNYDGDGRIAQRADDAGETSFSYNGRGLPASMTSSLSGTVSFTYDEAGRPRTADFGNTTKRYISYDPWGRVHNDTLKTGGTETTGGTVLYGATYGYDEDGNVGSKTTSGTGVPLAGQNLYTYDRASRITSWTGPGQPQGESYAWDKASNRTSAGSTSAQFDAQNRLTSTSSADGNTTFAWEPNGAMRSQTSTPAQRKVNLVVGDPAALTAADTAIRDHLAAAGASVVLLDDGAAAPTGGVDVIVVSPSVAAAALGTKYRDLAIPIVNLAAATWQTSGLSTQAPTPESTDSAQVETPSHPVAAGKTGTQKVLSTAANLDTTPATSLGTGAVRVWHAPGAPAKVVAAAYDTGAASPAGAAAQRRVVLGLSTAAVTNLNATGWEVFDAAIAWADNNPLKAGTTSYEFDAYEQLRKITPPNTAAVNHTYDPLGRRLSSPTGTLSYAGTGIRPVADGTHRYQASPIGTVAIDDMTAGGGTWGHTDSHTDVVGTFTAGATTLAGSQTFSPWGQSLAATGAASPLGYQSERQDLPGGLIGMGVREYNPATATFISRDPTTDPAVLNDYSYTNSNPLRATDPSGLCAKIDGLCAARWKDPHAVAIASTHAGSDESEAMRISRPKGYHWSEKNPPKPADPGTMALARLHAVNADPGFWHAVAKAGSAQAFVAAANASILGKMHAANPDPAFWRALAKAGSGQALINAGKARSTAIGRFELNAAKAKTGHSNFVMALIAERVLATNLENRAARLAAEKSCSGIDFGCRAGAVWDASGGVVVNGIRSCARDPKGCAVNVGKVTVAVAAAGATFGGCTIATGGVGAAGCAVAAGAVGGGVYGALSCPPGESRLKCAGVGAASGAVGAAATVACAGNAHCGVAAAGFVGGVASDVTAQLLTTGKVDVHHAIGSGALGATGAKVAAGAINRVRARPANPGPTTASSGAENAANPGRLNKQLASEAQMADAGSPIIGAGTKTPLRAANDLAASYGGDPADWAKMSSSSYNSGSGGLYDLFETHWYENVKTGQQVEFKTKFPLVEAELSKP